MKLNISKKIMLLVLVPILFICIVVGVASANILDKTITSEIEELLHVSAYNFKTEYSLTNNEELNKLIGDFKHDNNIDVTIFEDNRRVLSTIAGAVGTDMDNKILNSIRYGEDYFATNANVNGEDYFGYYIPIMENGEYTGASFTGIPQAEAKAIITSSVIRIISYVIVCGLVAAVVAMILVNSISKRIKKLETTINTLLNNDLTVKHEKSKIERDEIDILCNSSIDYSNNLNSIVGKIKNAAVELKDIASGLTNSTEYINQTSAEISKAVEDVAHGAVSQAEETTNATHMISDMSVELDSIKTNIDDMRHIVDEMNAAKNDVVDTMIQLLNVNGTITNDMQSTSEQVSVTSENVENIQKVVDVIKNIADETKLLSLNASIEAAKAGDAGRGFAVVAENIRTLAEQSAKSSEDIENILSELKKNYNLTIKNVENTSQNMSVQNDKLAETQKVFNTLEQNIDTTINKIVDINLMVNSINEKIKEVVDVISALSAISEENSASTEQTTASIQEQGASIGQVYEKAQDVDASADILMKEIDVFKVN